MTSLWELALFFPISLVIFLVLYATREEKPALVFKRSLKSLGILTLCLLAGCALIALIARMF